MSNLRLLLIHGTATQSGMWSPGPDSPPSSRVKWIYNFIKCVCSFNLKYSIV